MVTWLGCSEDHLAIALLDSRINVFNLSSSGSVY